MEVQLFDTKEESIAYIKKHHQQDIKWHNEDLEQNVRKKKYSWNYQIILIQHLDKLKGYSEISRLTHIDIGILKQWLYMGSIYGSQKINQEFQQLKVIPKPKYHYFSSKDMMFQTS